MDMALATATVSANVVCTEQIVRKLGSGSKESFPYSHPFDFYQATTAGSAAQPLPSKKGDALGQVFADSPIASAPTIYSTGGQPLIFEVDGSSSIIDVCILKSVPSQLLRATGLIKLDQSGREEIHDHSAVFGVFGRRAPHEGEEHLTIESVFAQAF